MAKSKLQKKETLTQLKENIAKSKSLVFVNFDGLNVKEVEELRKQCFEQNVGYVVAKKTLLKLAIQKAGIDIDPKSFDNSIATVFGFEDEVAPAKLVEEFAKLHPNLKTVAGVLEGQAVNAENIIALSKLPSRDELIAKVVGSIGAPLSGLVGVLSGNLRNFVGVLNAVKNSKEA